MAANGDEIANLADEVIKKIKLPPKPLQRAESLPSVNHSSSGMFSPAGASPGASHRGYRAHRTEPFIIGVAGGTASGKTTVCDQIVQRLNGKFLIISFFCSNFHQKDP